MSSRMKNFANKPSQMTKQRSGPSNGGKSQRSFRRGGKKRVDPINEANKTLAKLQNEVKQFALQAYDSTEKRKREQERAIRLGAKPKKRAYVNYKDLMADKKRQKLELEEKMSEMPQDEINRMKKTKSATNDAAATVFWTPKLKTQTFGQVGNYRNGVLKLSKQDMKSMKPRR